MARGLHTVVSTISTNTDTTLAAAPGAGQTIYLYWIFITTQTAGTASRVAVEDGAGGTVLARLATTTADSSLFQNYSTGFRNYPGRPLTTNTALNIETTGSAAATIQVEACYEVK